MSKLLVIGGSGFFGKSIIESHLRGDLRPFHIDRLAIVARHASGLLNWSVMRGREDIEVFDCDVRRLDTLLDSDIVMHAAAVSDANRYRDDPVEERSVIVDGTARVVELLCRAERRIRFVYVSSGAVYGPQPREVDRLSEDTPFAIETDSVRRVYVEAKRCAELLVRSGASRHGLQCAIARCFAFVGPMLPFGQHFAIGNFIGDALKGGPVRVKSSSKVIRSYMFADDLVIWLLTIARSSSIASPSYNVGSDQPISIRDVASIVAEVANVSVKCAPLDATLPTDRYVPNTDLAQRDLGVSLSYNLRRAIEETLLRYSSRGHLGERHEMLPASVSW